jgi:membrane protein implicated in regulation of membrane protease activity
MKRLKFRNERVGFVFTVAIGMAISILLDPVPFKFRLGLFAVTALGLVIAFRRAKARSEKAPAEETPMFGHERQDRESR